MQQAASKVIEVAQTGELASAVGAEVNDLSVQEPEPEPVDPYDGVKATNESGKDASFTYLNLSLENYKFGINYAT